MKTFIFDGIGTKLNHKEVEALIKMINENPQIAIEYLQKKSENIESLCLTPEDMAMLQALYSRDPRSVIVHMEKVQKSGSGNFMGQFYVNYGHKSIGDCGSTTMFIEDVSMLVAKAIQDWALYSGQEASTRYLDMSKQKSFKSSWQYRR